jgi:hypothetical protein
VAFAFTAWWGPGGGSMRRGTRAIVRGVTRNSRTRVVVLSMIALLAVSALITVSHSRGPDWTPLKRPASGSPR